MYKPIIFFHFTELKYRALYLALCLNITFIVCYNYCFEIIYIFTKPFLFYKKNFIFTDITEFFYTNIQICFFFTFYLILPLLLYHIWCFFVPSLLCKDRHKNSIFIFIFVFLIYATIVFVYCILLPKLFYFLVDFMIHNNLLNIELQPRIKSYVCVCINIYFFSSFLSLLPCVFFFIMKKNYAILESMCKNRIKNFFLILIISSMVSPPDIVLQICLSLCLFFFFEMLLLAGFVYRLYV